MRLGLKYESMKDEALATHHPAKPLPRMSALR